ncbi:hypothetical protein Ddc_24274 [Ditylenchus destructor]|nr:hypothetical protein Ddc_24274 [Ditylenchus destructor]
MAPSKICSPATTMLGREHAITSNLGIQTEAFHSRSSFMLSVVSNNPSLGDWQRKKDNTLSSPAEKKRKSNEGEWRREEI